MSLDPLNVTRRTRADSGVLSENAFETPRSDSYNDAVMYDRPARISGALSPPAHVQPAGADHISRHDVTSRGVPSGTHLLVDDPGLSVAKLF